MAIVHWDEDLYWKEGKWNCLHFKKGVINPIQMRLNAYRVLLTRGRDGTILYIPPTSILNSTYSLLKQIGINEI